MIKYQVLDPSGGDGHHHPVTSSDMGTAEFSTKPGPSFHWKLMGGPVLLSSGAHLGAFGKKKRRQVQCPNQNTPLMDKSWYSWSNFWGPKTPPIENVTA